MRKQGENQNLTASRDAHDKFPSSFLKHREIFESEASEVSTYLRGVHHSRKIAHRQVNYSDTVAKLGKFQQEVPVYLQKTDTISHSTTQSFGNTANGFQMQAYTDKMGTYILQEKDMNDRKRLYNREVGRKAIVNEVSGLTI